MTQNAGNGPSSPCGKVLVRVGHGLYQLGEATSAGRPPSARSVRPGSARSTTRGGRALGHAESEARLGALVADFDRWVDAYDCSVPFTRNGQYDLHRRSIERRRALGSAEAAVYDDTFTE